MSSKNQFPSTFNWQSTNPQTGFNPVGALYGGGSEPSGVAGGAMASTNTIYTNILDVSRMDNVGLEVAWSGTPTGTLSVLVSNSGINWSALTFSPPIGQPAGSAAMETIDLNQLPFKYLMCQYVNSTGSGTLNIYLQLKDLN